MKRKLLFIAPSSIPTFGAEAIVNKKLLTALTSSGKFEIDLVSQNFPYKHYPIDKNDNDIKLKSIHIIDNDLTLNCRTIWEHIVALFKFGITFKTAHWAVRALPTIENLVQQRHYDYIVTKDAPSFILGNYIKEKYGIKWAATWNDPYPTIKYPTPYGQGFAAKGDIFDRMCVSTMQNADIHIFPSDRIRNYMMKYLPNIDVNSTRVIPHIVLNTEIKSDFESPTLKILHSGTLQRPRNPQTFLRAFQMFKSHNPDSKIEVDILGILEKEDIQLITDLNIQDYVNFIPAVSYKDSLNLLSRYHIAMIIEAPCEEGIFLPTKVTDFIQYKKTIFAVSPHTGVLNDLYKQGIVSYFANVNDTTVIYETIKEIYTDFINKNIKQANLEPIYNFSEEAIINQYYNL